MCQKRRVGKRFPTVLADEFERCRSRLGNSERILVFLSIVLQSTKEVRRSGDICSQFTWRMDAWNKGKYKMLVQDTKRTLESQLSVRRHTSSTETIQKIFHQKVLWGDIRGTTHFLTECKRGRVVLPTDLCSKTQQPALEVLKGKHPSSKTPNIDIFLSLKKRQNLWT